MKYLLLLLFVISNFVYADEVKISYDPKDPVLGESLNVTFQVITKDGTDPIISFNPQGLEVLNKQETGVSTKTTYMNGRLTVERSISVVYEMIPNRTGSVYLSDINIEINGQKIRHKTIRMNVLRQARKAKDIMAVAVVDKESAFVGESILVRYYLYNKISVTSTDIKKFPKLDKFLKRFHQEQMRAERVQVGNDIYTRRIIYTAQLFAEKPGEYKIDPITLSVQYSERSSRYNSFGFGMQKQKSRTISSKPITLNIKQLPLENIPADFTGLVGRHEFKLSLNKNKFVVNEPIEIKFTVEGEGALELYESPKVLKDTRIEEFDASSDLVNNSDFTARKNFSLTYLGREALELEAKKVPFSYFDTEKLEYVTTYLDLGSIKIAGGAQRIESHGNKVDDPIQTPPTSNGSLKSFDMSPVYTLANSYIYNKKYILYGLLVILFLFISFLIKERILEYTSKEPSFYKVIKTEGADYGRLFTLVHQLGEGADMKSIVEKSNLKSKTKSYLIELISKCESDYRDNKNKKFYKLKSKYLEEIKRLTISKDEDS